MRKLILVSMNRTRLSFRNTALSLLGIVVSTIGAFLAVMTAGFGADPVHDVSSAAMVVILRASIALFPSALIGLWWSRIGVVTSWSIFVLCGLCALLGGAWHGMRFLIVPFVQSLIATTVDSKRNDFPKSDATPV